MANLVVFCSDIVFDVCSKIDEAGKRAHLCMSITCQQLTTSLAINSEFAIDIYEDFVLLGLQNVLDAAGVTPLGQETSEVFGAEKVCE
jgi:hypothetical protein